MAAGDQFNAKKERFQFGIAWMNLLTWSFTEHDHRIAIAKMRQTDMQITPFIEFTHHYFELDNC